MRVITTIAAAAVLCLAAAQPASAWHFTGNVVCAGGSQTKLLQVRIVVEDLNTHDIILGVTLPPSGSFFVPLPDTGGSYKAHVDETTLPPGTTVVMPSGGEIFFQLDANTHYFQADFKTAGPQCAACWLTGGGVKFDSIMKNMAGQSGPRDSFGGNIFPSCSSQPGNGGNMNVVLHSRKLHLQNTDITSVTCGNVEGIPPGSESPVTPYNFLEWSGTGRLVGIKGNGDNYPMVYVFGRAEDRNEPGNQHASSGEGIDRLFIRVFLDPGNPIGSTILTIDADGVPDATVDPLLITGGNLQIHASSCDDPPPVFPFF